MVKRLIMDNANVSHFERFQFLLRFEFNDLVHCVIDGTMCTPDSASAPEFFLHHGFVDKIWWDWQRQGSSHMFNEYFVSQTQRMPRTGYRSYDFLDLNNHRDVYARSTCLRGVQYMRLCKVSLLVSVLLLFLHTYLIGKHLWEIMGVTLFTTSLFNTASYSICPD